MVCHNKDLQNLLLYYQIQNNSNSYHLSDVLNYKLEKAGFMSALPYLVMAIVLQLSGHLADYLRSEKILTTTQVRDDCSRIC